MFRNTPASISHSSRDSPKLIRAPRARASRLAMRRTSSLPLRESQVPSSTGRVCPAEAGHPVLWLDRPVPGPRRLVMTWLFRLVFLGRRWSAVGPAGLVGGVGEADVDGVVQV